MSTPTFCKCNLCEEIRKKAKYPKCSACGEHHDSRLGCPAMYKKERATNKIKKVPKEILTEDCEYFVSLDGGKYKVYIINDPYEFKALRHGEEWRDLCGDNLIFNLVYELDEAQKKIKTAIKMLNGPGVNSAHKIKKYLEAK